VSFTGNENIHLMTSQGDRQELRIEMVDWNGTHAYALYDNFAVGSKNTNYKLTSVGKYSGTAGTQAPFYRILEWQPVGVIMEVFPFTLCTQWRQTRRGGKGKFSRSPRGLRAPISLH